MITEKTAQRIAVALERLIGIMEKLEQPPVVVGAPMTLDPGTLRVDLRGNPVHLRSHSDSEGR